MVGFGPFIVGLAQHTGFFGFLLDLLVVKILLGYGWCPSLAVLILDRELRFILNGDVGLEKKHVWSL